MSSTDVQCLIASEKSSVEILPLDVHRSKLPAGRARDDGPRVPRI